MIVYSAEFEQFLASIITEYSSVVFLLCLSRVQMLHYQEFYKIISEW